MFLVNIIKKGERMQILDLTALRTFVAVSEFGGVTRAAGIVNLTQSAVSMQIKRLETMLDLPLFERRSRTLILTPAGEQLLGYARRMLDLNDEAVMRLTTESYEGELTLGVPHDIVYPAIPQVLQELARQFPRVKINLISSYTGLLHQKFAEGAVDIILTTEVDTKPGGEVLVDLPLVFVGAPNGKAWQERPLRLAFEENCVFRPLVQTELDRAGIAWELAVSTRSSRTVEATVSADLAVHAMIAGTARDELEEINGQGHLPDLGMQRVNMYKAAHSHAPVSLALQALLRPAFARLGQEAVGKR